MTSTPRAPFDTSGVRVRSLHRCDLTFVVRLHRAEFPSNVVTRLGSAMLRAYYVSFITSPHAVAYAVEKDGQAVGYLVGVVRPGAHRRRLLRRHLPRLGPTVAMGAVANPRLTVGLLKARGARRRAGSRGDQTQPSSDCVTGSEPAVAVLSHVAIAQEHRGQGLGAPLVAQFEREGFGSGATRLHLATAEDSAAASFYERRGWTLIARRKTFDQRPISLYELDREETPRCIDPAS